MLFKALPIEKHSDLEQNKDKVLVFSLDFDGCVFNAKYCNSTEPERLIKYNKKLIEHILQEIQKQNYQEVIFLVGSNRQGFSTDRANSKRNNSGSCFPAIIELCEAIQKLTPIPCRVDRFLMADLYSARPAGTNFSAILEKNSNIQDRCIWDEFKFSLIYAQMHYLSSKQSSSVFDFNFIDDRVDILSNLTRFLTHQEFIPRNISTLNLKQYQGAEVITLFKNEPQKELATNSVTPGPIDYHYRTNIPILAKCAKVDVQAFIKSRHIKANISACFDELTIERFKAERLLSFTELLKLYKQSIYFEMKHHPESETHQQQLIMIYSLLKDLHIKVNTQLYMKNVQSLRGELIRINTSYLSLLRTLLYDKDRLEEQIKAIMTMSTTTMLMDKLRLTLFHNAGNEIRQLQMDLQNIISLVDKNYVAPINSKMISHEIIREYKS